MTDQPAAGDEAESTQSLERSEAAAIADAGSNSQATARSSDEQESRSSEADTAGPEPSTTGAVTNATSSGPERSSVDTTFAKPSDATASSEASSDVVATSERDDETTLTTSALESGEPASETTSTATTDTPPFDECPDQESELVASNCGCGHGPDPLCDVLHDALSHRYSFVSHAAEQEYDTAAIADTVGSAHGSIHDAEFDWDGSLLMDGQDGYVELPAGLLSAHEAATVDLWVKWWGGDDNQRLLNFGVAPNDSDDAPDNYLSISPSGSNGVLTVQYRTNPDERGDRLETATSLGTSDLHHITVVIREQSLSLFVDGRPQATVETEHRLKELEDDDNWLGRALYSGYPLYSGAFFEFRIFGRALTDAEVEMLDRVGLGWP